MQKDNANLIDKLLISNQSTKVTAEQGMRFSLLDAKTGQSAKKLKAKKSANDLLIADENGDTLLTIEDYYITDDVQLGTVSDSGFSEFDYVSSETGVISQVALETSYTTLVSEMSGGTSIINGVSNTVLLGSLGAAALGAVAFSGGSSSSSKQPVNDIPISKDSTIAATEDTIATSKLEAATDADGDALTYAIATNAANGKVVIGKDGSYTYTPNANFNGEDSFTYTINDGKGGVITQTATVNVAAGNDAPVSANTTIAATEDTVAKDFLAKATDVDGDALTYTLATGAANGKVTIGKDGSYSYTPNANFNGKDSFTYTVTDGTETITKTANMTVASVNDVPISKDSTIAATEDTIATSKLEAATDADGDALTYAIATNAANGKVVIGKDGSYTYTPNANFNGEDSFTYTINDGKGGVITQTATVNVAAVNDVPVSKNSIIGVAENIIDTGVLTEATDVDGDTLTYALLTEAENGTVTVNANGSYTYTPNTDFTGEDNFTYTVNDGQGGLITKTANVTISSLDQKSKFELQEVFETSVINEQQVVVGKQALSFISELIEFEITGENGMPQLDISNSSNIINGYYSYELEGSRISTSSSGSISSVGSNNYSIDFNIDTLPLGKYIIYLYVESQGSSIDFNVTEFKDVETIGFTGYQDITGNIFADESGAISTPSNYEIQIGGQSLVFQTGSPAASPITIDTDNGKLTIAADGSYVYRSDRNDLGLEAESLAEDFYVKVIDLDTKQASHYGINISSDTTPPEPGELVFNDFEDTGLFQDDGITSDRSFDLAISNNERGSQVEYQYSTDQGVTWQALANGTASNLSDGDYIFRAKVTDEALNESFTTIKDITIDTTAPILGNILNFNTTTNQLEVDADIDQDTLQAFKSENGTLILLDDASNIPFVEGNYQIKASDIAGNSTTLDFAMATASGEYRPLIDGIDIVKGTAGNDTIYGGNGDDILISNDSRDTLYGEAGNDTLIYGGNGSSGAVYSSRFEGGQGDDTYIFNAKSFLNNTQVNIDDFNGSNKLELKGFDTSEITLARVDTHLYLSTGNGTIYLGAQFSTGGVDNIYFDDGTAWDRATIEAMSDGGYSSARSVMSFDRVDEFNTEIDIFANSQQIELPKIDDLLDTNSDALVFESTDTMAITKETATTTGFSGASNQSTVMDFSIVQALDNNMQTEAMFHII